MINRDYKNRRDKLLKNLNDNSVAVIFSADEKLRNNDVAYKYRQSSNFFYLSGIDDPSLILIFLKKNKTVSSILICNKPNNKDKIWTGQLPSKNSYKKQYSIDRVLYADQLNELDLKDIDNLYYEFSDRNHIETFLSALNKMESTRYTKKNDFLSSRINLSNLIYDMRRVKSKYEITQIAAAANVSSLAHHNLMRTCKPGMNECEIEADFTSICMSNHCKQAYPAIVATGKNGCILHYTKNNSILKKDDLLLVDAAAEYNNYASDITRTIPVSGKFNIHQKEIYDIVLKAQKMAIKSCKPGKTLVDIHDIAVKNITKGLIDVKILKGSLESNIKNQKYKKYYMHNTGHWLGLDVHDPCAYVLNDKPVRLKPGMVFTVEPGIYINTDSDVDKNYHNIAVRIEDDVLITSSGHKVITENVPKEVNEIEKLMSSG